MNFSLQGRHLLDRLEGRSATVYLDSGGAPTIGIGHLLTKSERLSGKIRIGVSRLPYQPGLNPTQIERLLNQDLKPIETILSLEPYCQALTQSQYDVLCCFVFNVGIRAFMMSTLRKRLQTGDFAAVPAQLRRWVYDNGQIIQGLVNRREQEVLLWQPQETL
jgi:lysozyme